MVSHNQGQRIHLSPQVEKILQQKGTREAELLQGLIRFGYACIDEDLNAIDAVVTPDAFFHDLEEAGMPNGPEGLKLFRRLVNTAFPDEEVTISDVKFDGDIVISEVQATGTHKGDFMGIPPTGRKVTFTIHGRDRFVGDRVAERWDRIDVQDLMRQLTGPQ